MLGNLKNISDRLNAMETQDEFKLRMINIEDLVPSEKNMYGIRDVEELAADIKENGLYHNLVVRETESGKYEILSGERRYHALKSLGHKKIPCQVRNLDDLDFEIMLIQANAKTRELTNGEKMKQVERLKVLYTKKRGSGEKLEGKTRDLIGNDLGMSGVQVGRYMKIAEKLDEPLKEKFEKDEITLRDADKLASLPKENQVQEYQVLKQKVAVEKQEVKAENQDFNLKQEVVREEKFVPDTSELEKAAEPIKEMLIGLSNDVSLEDKLKELIEVVNRTSKDSIAWKTKITNRAEGNVMHISKKITMGMAAQKLIIATVACNMQIELKNIESVEVSGDKAKLVTKGMIIEF